MAQRKRSRGTALGGVSLIDLASELYGRRDQLRQLQDRREEIIAELEQIDNVLAAFGGGAPARGRSGARKVGRPARIPSSSGRTAGKPRGKRGQGWATIESALAAAGDSAKTADLKAAWAKFGSRTPLSVALASFVKSGKLTRKGKGRDTVFSLNK